MAAEQGKNHRYPGRVHPSVVGLPQTGAVPQVLEGDIRRASQLVLSLLARQWEQSTDKALAKKMFTEGCKTLEKDQENGHPQIVDFYKECWNSGMPVGGLKYTQGEQSRPATWCELIESLVKNKLLKKIFQKIKEQQVSSQASVPAGLLYQVHSLSASVKETFV